MSRCFATSTIFLHKWFDVLCMLCRFVKFTMEFMMLNGPTMRTADANSDCVSDVFSLQPKSKKETSTLPKGKEASILLQQYDLFTTQQSQR